MCVGGTYVRWTCVETSQEHVKRQRRKTRELKEPVTHSAMRCIYGRLDTTIEQINNSTGTVTYLHHDQAGSTRLITGSTGKVEGAYTYTPYGAVQEHTGTATTPLGYDGQYTNTDTGLIYLRVRSYDPATAQFLTVDPLVAATRAPYSYAGDRVCQKVCVNGLVGVRPLPGYCAAVSLSP